MSVTPTIGFCHADTTLRIESVAVLRNRYCRTRTRSVSGQLAVSLDYAQTQSVTDEKNAPLMIAFVELCVTQLKGKLMGQVLAASATVTDPELVSPREL